MRPQDFIGKKAYLRKSIKGYGVAFEAETLVTLQVYSTPIYNSQFDERGKISLSAVDCKGNMCYVTYPDDVRLKTTETYDLLNLN